MKLSNLAYGIAGYVLGARAGHERFEQIVRVARRVQGSQTVQSAAGVAQAQLERTTTRAKHAMGARLSSAAPHHQHPGR